jgi:hypothetical protein
MAHGAAFQETSVYPINPAAIEMTAPSATPSAIP